MDHVAGRFVLLDAFQSTSFSKKFGLMLMMEIFESEYNFKSENGGDALIQKLKDAGYYPYSDMDRSPVV